jgi:hypothetical protein
VRFPVFGNHAPQRAKIYIDQFAFISWHKHQTEDKSLTCTIYNMPTSDMPLTAMSCWRPLLRSRLLTPHHLLPTACSTPLRLNDGQSTVTKN